jgi:membrane protein YqaA with SNARE-associated domain
MLRRLYDWMLDQADKPHAAWLLSAISFAESSFFPLPPDFLLVPMMLADRRRCFQLATLATLTSVLGGFLGYAIGYFAFETVGRSIIDVLSSQGAFDYAQAKFAEWGFWLIIWKGATPIPYKIVTIFCGFVHYDLAKFTIASIVARGMRFYIEAAGLYFFGQQARFFIEKRLTLVTTVGAGVVLGGVLLLHYV